MQFSQTGLQKLNTLNLPARANFAVLSDVNQLDSLADIRHDLFFLGGGSNVVMQQNISPYVVQVALKGISLLQETSEYFIIQAHAGENWHNFVVHCLHHGWYGLENLALIPGTVGAAPVQNIGAYGVELDQLLHSVVAINMQTGKTCELSGQECEFAYRDSMFKRAGFGKWLIVKVNFALPKSWHANISYPDLQNHSLVRGHNPDAKNIFAAVCDIRTRKLPDPAVLPNAGSFFKNPIVDKDFAAQLLKQHAGLRYFPQADGTVKLAAAWLIDQAGWRGKSMGPAGMHARQALVMVNHGGANADDIIALATQIKSDVKQKFDVTLEQEPVFLH